MIYKTFEAKSSFYVKENTSGKVFCYFLRAFLLVLKKVPSWQKNWVIIL